MLTTAPYFALLQVCQPNCYVGANAIASGDGSVATNYEWVDGTATTNLHCTPGSGCVWGLVRFDCFVYVMLLRLW